MCEFRRKLEGCSSDPLALNCLVFLETILPMASLRWIIVGLIVMFALLHGASAADCEFKANGPLSEESIGTTAPSFESVTMIPALPLSICAPGKCKNSTRN